MLPLEAKTRKGDKYFAEGKVHEVKKEWDAALDCYQKALQEDPAEMVYQIARDRTRFQAAQGHVELGLRVRAQGRLGEALLEFQKAYSTDPSSVIAAQELSATNQMILRERERVQQTGKESAPELRGLTLYEEARRKEDEKIGRMLAVPELAPPDPTPEDWHLSGQKTKKVFEAIGKIAGINVLWDPEYTEPAGNLTIDLQKATVEQAFDYVSAITKSYWKALSPNTIFVFNDNQNKRRDFEELVTKVFYLQNVTQPAEIQEMQQILRTGCDIQRVFPYNAAFALVVRGEADRVALCQKLIRDIDRPKSEVLIDIMVMDASTTFSKQITAAIASTGLNLPLSFSPRSSIQVQSSSTATTGTTATTTTGTTTTGTTSTGSTVNTTPTSSTTGTQIPLNELTHISTADFATTLPGALLQAALSDTRSKVLNAPQIRAVDNVKAIMNIGERVPVASGSFQPGVGGIGINPLVNTQFNYQDVGVNVEVTARVLEGNEVYMHLKIDVSEIDGYQTQGGIQEPIIGQRKIEQELRVKDGEVALIGGLIQQTDDLTVTGIPGLASIPILGNLFKGKSTDHNTDNLMIVMIPHVIRRQDYSPDNLRAIDSGTQTIGLHYAPPKPVDIAVDGQLPADVVHYPPSGAADPVPSVAPGTPAPGAGPRMMPIPGPVPPATAPPLTVPAGMVPPATAPPATAPPATALPAGASGSGEGDKPQAARVRFNPPEMEATVSSSVTVSVEIDGGHDVASAPMVIHFDPKMLKLNDVTAGDFLAADGQTPVLTKNIQNDAGQATVVLNRPPGMAGVTAPGGVLVKLSFQTVTRGSTTVTIPNLSVRDSQGQVIATGNPELKLSIH